MKRIWIVLGALGVFTAAVAVAFYRLRCEISYSFDFGSVLDAIALLLVGVLVEYVYLKQSSDKRADTDLLLGIVGEAKVAFGELVDEAEVCESEKALTAEQRVAVTCAERELSNAVHSIEEGLRACSVNLDKLGFEKLKEARAELKDSLTDTPFPGPYDHASRARIRTAMKVMRDELTRIAFAINHR